MEKKANKEEMLQEMQILEQNLQNTLVQKQSLQMELAETNSALEELKKSDGEVYKVVGGLMIKSDKARIQKEMEEKIKFAEAKIVAIGKQEEFLEKKVEEIRKEMIGK